MEIFEEYLFLLQAIEALLMPLDKPTVRARLSLEDKGPAKKHWVGANGEWVAFVQHPGRWYIQNVYTLVNIELPRVEDVGIRPVHDNWRTSPPPLLYEHRLAETELLKIQITDTPIMRGDEWHYTAIAVFETAIAIINRPRDSAWIILRNDYLAPASYVDAMATHTWGKDERIYAVTKPQGDVLVWQPYKWGTGAGPRLIKAPVVDPGNVQAAGGDVDPEELASPTWYLAPMINSNSLLWIHTRGEHNSDVGSIEHMGRVLRNYPSVSCHVFVRDGWPLEDPVAPDWFRLENLEGRSAFVGINYPFFLEAPDANPNGDEALPLFKPDCVFATHVSARKRPQPRPDWIRMHVARGPAIGSSLYYEQQESIERIFEAPMWFVPTIPRAPFIPMMPTIG